MLGAGAVGAVRRRGLIAEFGVLAGGFVVSSGAGGAKWTHWGDFHLGGDVFLAYTVVWEQREDLFFFYILGQLAWGDVVVINEIRFRVIRFPCR